MLEELVAGCRVNVERLRGEIERIGKLLADAARELERLLTARQVLSGLRDAHPPTMGVKLPAPRAGRPEPGSGGGAERRRVEGEAFIVAVLDVLSGSRSPMRCKDVVAALGGDVEVPLEAEKVGDIGVGGRGFLGNEPLHSVPPRWPLRRHSFPLTYRRLPHPACPQPPQEPPLLHGHGQGFTRLRLAVGVSVRCWGRETVGRCGGAVGVGAVGCGVQQAQPCRVGALVEAGQVVREGGVGQPGELPSGGVDQVGGGFCFEPCGVVGRDAGGVLVADVFGRGVQHARERGSCADGVAHEEALALGEDLVD
ncbi:hypothetical protein ACWGMA_49810 [Streptomyces asiaticus]